MASMSSHSLSTPAQDAAAAAMLDAQPVQVREHFRVAYDALQVPKKYWTVIIMMTLSRTDYTPELKAFIVPTIQAHQDVINEVLELVYSIGDEMRQRSKSMVVGSTVAATGSTVAATESSKIDSDSDKESSCCGGGGGGNGGGDGDGGGSNNTCL